MNILSSLIDYGLSESEAQIYKVLLEMIEGSVYSIAKTAKIPRTSTYTALESLEKQGLVQCFKKNNILFYTPESPRMFLNKLDEKKEIMKSILPQMQALIDESGAKPVTKLYEGKEGFKTVKDDVLEVLRKEKNPCLLVIANADMYRFLPKYFPEWTEQRVEYGIPARLILPDSAQQSPLFTAEMNKKFLREVRFLPPPMSHECSINIYKDKVALFTLKEKEEISVIIESKAISHMFREFFLLNWGILKNQV